MKRPSIYAFILSILSIFFFYSSAFAKTSNENISEGIKFYKAGDYDKAISVFEEVLKYDPSNPVALSNIGFIYYKIGKLQIAKDYLTKSLKYIKDKDIINMTNQVLADIEERLSDKKESSDKYIENKKDILSDRKLNSSSNDLYSSSYIQMKVKPGKVSMLEIETPKILVAGEEYIVKVKATDGFGNPSNNFGSVATLNIKSDGLNIVNNVITPKDIVDGVFYIKIIPSKVGEYKVNAFLGEKQLSFRIKPSDNTVSQLNFRVVNGKAENVVISSSDTFLPGYRYNVRFLFYDKEGNPVIDKEHLNQTITITAEKFSKEINIKDISGYQYEVDIIPNSIVNFDIYALDNSRQKKLASKTVRPEIQTIERFEVELPQEIEAGSPFKVRVKALDSAGRLIKVYDKIGKDVKLVSTGSGQLIPNIIQREQFKDGVAEIDLVYTKSELINIYASVSTNKEPITTIKPYTVKEEKPKETVNKAPEVKSAPQNEQIKSKKPEKTSIKLRFPVEMGHFQK